MSPTTAGRAGATTVMYVVESPCCRRRVLVEGWELEYSRHNRKGVIRLRCGTLLDTPGWHRRDDYREGCGGLFTIDANEVKIRHSGEWG